MYLNKFRIEFVADDVECELIVGANGYEDVKERFFERLRESNLDGLYLKSVDRDLVDSAENYIKEGKVTERNIKRTVKLDN